MYHYMAPCQQSRTPKSGWGCGWLHVFFLSNSVLSRMAERPKYQFKSVQLLKDQSLGIGSYGAVCKAKCDDLLCAAKIIHPTLFDPTALQQIPILQISYTYEKTNYCLVRTS